MVEEFLYSSGGTVTKAFFEINHYSTGSDENLSWDSVQKADRYAVYRQDNGLYIWIGETNTTSFADGNIEGDQGLSPPKYRDPFPQEYDQPGTVGYYEQRQVFGGSTNQPDQSNFSRTGDYNNFSYSSPQKADDSMEVSLPAGQVNEIRHYVTLNDLIVFTSDSEWKISSSGTDKGFGIDTIKQQLQTRWGCSHRPPIVYGNTILYVTNNNSDVRSMGYSLEKDGYTGSNLNILSRHFLRGHTVVDWTSQVSPDSRIYMVRDDGIALTLGFDQEQELVAWTSFTTDGIFEGVESLPRGGTYEEDSVYWVVKRQVNGNTVRFIEVMRDTYFDSVKDCFFVDAGLTYDEPITITGISSTNPVVITAPGHGLSNDAVVDLDDIIWDISYDEDFNEVFVDQLNNGRYTVKNVTTDTFEIQDDDGDVDGTSFVSYNREGTVRLTVQTITGLWHLEGRTLVGLVDGNVITDLTVTDGTITLPNLISRGHFGLRNICDVVTLPWPASSGQTMGQGTGTWKKLAKVVLKLFKTRGVKLGPSTSQLIEIKQREFEKYNEPTGLLTGEKEVIILPSWNKTGQVYLRQSDPLPFTLLSVTPYVEVGDE